MTGQLKAVRLVRCPRCRGLLQESPNVPVYECGGCGAVLKAKNRKNDTKDTGSHVRETETAQKNKLEHVSDCKESGSLCQEEALASKGELPSDKNCVFDQNEIQDSKREQSEDTKFSRVLSTGLASHGNENVPAVRAEMEVDRGQCSLEQNNERRQNEYGFCNKKQTDGLSFSDEVTCSTEPSQHENEEPALVDGAYSELAKEQDNGRNKNEYGYCNSKQPGGLCFSNELISSTEPNHHPTEVSSPVAGTSTELDLEENNGKNQNCYGFYRGEQPQGVSFSDEVASSTELDHHGSGESSPVDGAYGEISLEQNNGRNQNHDGYCNGKEALDASFSSELASSTELHHNESGESSPMDGAYGEISMEQNSGRNRNHDGYCNGKEPLDASFSTELASSTKLHHNESGESSPMDGAYGEISLEQNNGRNRNHDGYCNGKEPLDASFSNELASSTELHHNESGESSPIDGAYGDVDLVQNNGRNQNHYGCCYGKEPLDVSFSSELALSTELNHHENEESLPVAGTYNVVDLEQNNGWDNEHGYCNWKQPRGVSFSDELASSSELNPHEIKEPSLEAVAYNEMDLEQSNGRNQNEYGCYNGKQPGSVNFSNVIASSTELNHRENEELSQLAGVHREVDENKDCLEQSSGRNQNEFGDFQTELLGFTKISNGVSSCTGLTCQEIEELSTEVGTNTELVDNFNSRFVFRSSNVENLLSASPRDEIITAHMPLGEKVLADQMSPHSEELEPSQKRALNSFDPASSTDTLENVAFAKPSSGFGVILKDMPKSPTTRSYYACDSNVSSYDGTYDQVPSCTRAMPRRDEAMYNITSNYPETQHQAWNCSSEKKHCSRKGSKWGQDELSESRKQRHPGRSRMKFETDDRLSRMPYYSRGRQVGYENGRSSRYGQSEFQCSTSSHPPGKWKYLELEEKMELLKMVNELQDRLNRTNISEGKGNGRFPGVSGVEKQIPSYYDRAAQQVECHDLRNTRYSGRRNQGRHWPRRSRISQIPFSANATISKHQVDRSCLPCCPQDWQYSAPLPSHICCNKSQHTIQKRTYNLYHCGPSSSQHYTGSEFSLESTIHHDEEKKYSRDKLQLAKRHVRPVASGAPFVVCYGCSELLLLPVDFLLFKRRCHELRCSACSVILKFSLQNGTEIVPYTDTIAPPPPSEFDGRRDANNGGKLASVFHAEPMSCSDDYGPPVCKSGSTEGETFSVPLPFHTLKRNSSGRRVSATSSLEPMEERKMQPVSIDSQNFASRAGTSSNLYKAEKISSEIEELPPTASSALHTLMGYSSPSEVITNGC